MNDKSQHFVNYQATKYETERAKQIMNYDAKKEES